MGILPKIVAATAAVALAVLDCNPSLYIFDKVRDVAKPEAFRSKNVWITGASSGIGEELALQLSAAGANVVISARREGALKAVKDRCAAGAGSGAVHVVPLDVTDEGAVTKAVDDVVDKHFAGKGLDLLILNAGKSQRVPAMDTDLQTTSELMKLNYESLVDMTQKVMKVDKWSEKGRGHVVVTSSVAGKLPVALSSSYSASKAAVNAYFSSLRSELRWLRVDIVCPGPIATPIGESVRGAKRQSEMEPCSF